MSTGKKQILLGGLILGIVGLIVWSNVWKSNLTVSKVTVEGNRIVEANEILQLAQVKPGTPLYDLDLAAIRDNVVSNFFIKDAVVERDLPSTIRITVRERSPIAIINRADILYIDEEGVVLPHSISKETFDLPILSGLSSIASLKVGATLRDDDVQEALTILSASKLVNKELYHLISEVHLRNGGDIVLYAAEWGVPIIMGRGDIACKLVRLETFWNEVVRQRGSQALQYVDLRYEDQVVVRWRSSPA
ncbi:MAG TPA: FtsQ-type POTRA domain-containing protein [Bacteroidota bacterium]|nr:FtsQ-type POTRA domain-containing protein [Bacteroidota bacterium]